MMNSSANINPEISIVLLTLNEINNIGFLIDEVISVCRDLKFEYELIVSDGSSSDGTLDLLKKKCLKIPELKIIISPEPGYGIQLMCGLKHCRGKKIIYMDGDGQYNAEDIGKIIKFPDGSVVSAVRQINDNILFRKFSSYMFSSVIRLVTDLRIDDFTSGFKLLPGEFAREIHIKWGKAFLGSTEIMIIADKTGIPVYTMPVHCRKRRSGTSKLISLNGIFAVLNDLKRLVFK